MDIIDIIPWAIGAFLVALLGFVFYMAMADDKEWATFAAAHNCKVVGQISGSSTTAVGIAPSNGAVTITPVYIPGKTGYQCDDGVTYWR